MKKQSGVIVMVSLVVALHGRADAGGESHMLDPGHGLGEALHSARTPPSNVPLAPGVNPARTPEIELTDVRIKTLETALLKNLDYIQKVAISLLEMKDAFQELAKRDLDFDPNIRPAGFPGIPVSCGASAPRGSADEVRGDCQQCYQAAQTSLHKAAFTLEKLRLLHKRTKAMVDKAISFGDTTSGIHAVPGLAWQGQRTAIVKSIKKMDDAFDAKKPELMERLKGALEEIAECETKYFSNPDWYDRFGFMYYQTMSANTVRN